MNGMKVLGTYFLSIIFKKLLLTLTLFLMRHPTLNTFVYKCGTSPAKIRKVEEGFGTLNNTDVHMSSFRNKDF